jgi:hypothetical protein
VINSHGITRERGQSGRASPSGYRRRADRRAPVASGRHAAKSGVTDLAGTNRLTLPRADTPGNATGGYPGDRPGVPQAAGAKANLGELRRTVAAINANNDPAFGRTGVRLGQAVDSLERATQWLLARQQQDAALADAAADPGARIAIARFFAENIAVT